jgi:hypothetical protein
MRHRFSLAFSCLILLAACRAQSPSTPKPGVATATSSAAQSSAQTPSVDSRANSGANVNSAKSCDESADCGAGQACCLQFVASGVEAAVCVAHSEPGVSPCDFYELCHAGKPCRAEAATCSAGKCRPASLQLSCGSELCDLSRETCCGDPPACRQRCAPDAPTYECKRPADCLKGQHCAMNGLHAACRKLLDIANSAVVCESERDCPATPFCKAWRCGAPDAAGLKLCECQ